ncbi:MAG TPA: MiaB/RimO family radical SAM methylthiotransferase [Terriglobales bacterium]|nr:MiaB/RimO family radical SAM methylthiotransferase [Terriglobales bacterium]
MRGYYIQNFGCRAAQADGSAIERQLTNNGLRRVSATSEADIVVLNTCTVTSAADQDARAAIRRSQRERPEAKILVTGCYAQRAPEEIAALDGVTWVVGNSHKHQIGNIIAGSSATGSGEFVPLTALDTSFQGANFAPKIYASDIFAHTQLQSAPVFEAIERTRPNLKIQDGCDNRCSFCVIPYVRGHSRSLAIDKILREIHDLEAAGYREIVISGINLGRWGRDFAAQKRNFAAETSDSWAQEHQFEAQDRFVEALRVILERTSVEKLRLSSIEPMDWTDDLIALMASSKRIAKHAHVPLQSGSDRILRKMHRKYRPWHYAEKVEKIRSAMPDAAIGADVMVGFPGESDELFEESRAFIAKMPFTYLHVFTYSPRPGTPAATMPDQVPLELARERNRELRNLAAEKNVGFRSSFLGRTVEAITLAKGDSEMTEALSDNYLKVEIKGQHEANRWMRVRVGALTEHGMSGESGDRVIG